MSKHYFCIDVGGSAIKYAVLDEELVFLDKGSVPTPHEGTKEYLDTLEALYAEKGAGTKGIAMSAPGMIDSENGICITGGNLTYIEDFPLAEQVKARCGVPVTVMNDAKAAALAESRRGSLSDCQDAVVIVLGTGIGGALIKDKNVHMGSNFAAGEFSFFMMEQECDQEFSTWAYRSGNPRLMSLAARVKGVPAESITGFDVFRWAQEGDAGILNVLDKFTKDIAFMIMNLQFVFDPERFAIGGGISRQPLLLEYIRKNLDYYYSIYPSKVPHAQVTTCKYFNDANLIGALEYHLDRVGRQ